MIDRWDIITIGNLSRNRYWGESEEQPLRAPVCTCTLITGEGFRLLVDPSLSDAAQMAAELDRRSGLKPAQINAVFVTHSHGDHLAGLDHFPEAAWLAAPAVADEINGSGKHAKPVAGVEGRLLDAIDVIPTPGHTPGHHSLRFDCEGASVVIAGDAVMTRDFWRDQAGFRNSVDFAQAAETIRRIGEIADIIVPGHDNWFCSRRVRLAAPPPRSP